MKFTFLLLCSLLLWSCSNAPKEKSENKTTEKVAEASDETPVEKEDLIEVNGNTYTEYYDADKTRIKFKGEQDQEKRRHGKWVHFHENGLEAGITFYTHGVRNGFSSVKRPSGAMYYHGEYKDDKPAGIWKYYDEDGKFSHEQDYDTK